MKNLWHRIVAFFHSDDPHLQFRKGGRNDLGRWKQYGGTLERPAPPAPIRMRGAA